MEPLSTTELPTDVRTPWAWGVCPQCQKLLPPQQRVGTGRIDDGGFCSLNCFALYGQSGHRRKLVSAPSSEIPLHATNSGGAILPVSGISWDRESVRRASGAILPCQAIRRLVEADAIRSATGLTPTQVQPASLDLRLGADAYRVRASFLPGNYRRVVDVLPTLQMHQLDLTKPVVLEQGCVYIIKLLEELQLPDAVSALASAKSSTGRVDVFTRLITDRGEQFDTVPSGYCGPLFLEVVPRSFSVIVQEGLSLCQIRFISVQEVGVPDSLSASVVFPDRGRSTAIPTDQWITVDLECKDETHGFVGYRARRHSAVVDLRIESAYDALDFWEPIPRTLAKPLVLNPGDFYILSSLEYVSVPADAAAILLPFDASAGELRIHYAGFFDPGFGLAPASPSKAVLEVRCWDIPYAIEHGQRMGRFAVEPLAAHPDENYGNGDFSSHYQGQGLRLSKHFR